MTSAYGHFCLAARALETVGDRWSLLIVRDLLAGPRRFGDLRRLLTAVTAKSLTVRLRQLEAEGIVRREQEPGRKEVRYELTDKGRDLAPVLEALVAWGLRHELHPPTPSEVVHPEHLMAGLRVALNEVAPKPPEPQTWRFDFGDGRSFSHAFDGERWTRAVDGRPPDATVETTPRAWVDFATRPRARRRLPTREIRLSGVPDRVADLVATLAGA